MQVMNRVVCVLAALLPLAVPAQEPGQPPQQPAQQRQDEIRSEAEGDKASRLTLKLKDRDLADVVTSIRKKANANIIMDPSTAGAPPVTIDLQDVHWRTALTLVAEQAGCLVSESEGLLKIEKPPVTTFSFENTDIQKVVDTIAKISGANIVVAPEVKGTITVRLKNIPWRHALDACVKTLGFVVVEEQRGILRVVPAANIQQDLETRTYQLRFVRPSSTYVPFIESQYIENKRAKQALQKGEIAFTLIDTLKGMVTPEIGRLQYMQENNVVVVTDTKPVLENIRRAIEMIDVEPSQIQLDVRFVTTSNEDVLDVGMSPGGTGWTAGLGLGQIPVNLPFNLGTGGWDDRIIVDPSGNASGGGAGPFADVNAGDTVIPDVVFGALNLTQVSTTLRLLKKDARSEITQAPQITVLDGVSATIFVGEAIRYAQARVEQGQAGGLLLALEEGDESPVNVGFQLLTTPHIVPGTDKVILEVIPQRTALSGTGSSAIAPAGFDVFTVGAGGSTDAGQIALPRVSSSTLSTTVLLRSGQTAVLGGLKTKSESETITKLPLLGDIPVLGWLFKGKVSNQTTATLLVFITPQVIRSAEDVQNSLQKALEERMRDHNSSLQKQREAIFGKG